MLLGRTPMPGEAISALQQRVELARSSLAKRSNRPFVPAVVTYEDPGLESVRSRNDIGQSFPGLNWRPALVDLRNVLSFQKLINVDGLDERLDGAASPNELLELCLPSEQPMLPLGAFGDTDGKGFTISSHNPNLRIAGGQISEAQVAPNPAAPTVRMHAVTLFVHMGTSYLQVATYKGRSFLRDGYHRAAGLIKRGIYVVPCIHIDAATFEQVGLVPGALSYEVLYGDQPPLIADFWDPLVSADSLQPAVRKVIRIKGEEFVVPR